MCIIAATSQKMLMKILLALCVLAALAACAGSPVHTSSLTAEELKIVDDRTLCIAWHPRQSYYPSEAVMKEVDRRVLISPGADGL